MMYKKFLDLIQSGERICVIQAENPDGDSLGSALALSEILQDKEVTLYCPVEIPKYLRYLENWSLVGQDFDYRADAYIIVDTAAEVLLSKVLDDPAARKALHDKPVLVIDHHETEDDLSFAHEAIIEVAPACCDVIFRMVRELGMEVSATAAENLLAGILSDTLGLSSAAVQAETFRTVAELVELGTSVWQIEEKRHEFMKKSRRILNYKAELIGRVEYYLEGKLAVVHVPWEEIKLYSDEYNPNVLILEELRMVTGVEVAVAIKTYPDGKLTGKIRSYWPIAEQIAGYYGGGGHKYAAGFRVYDMSYEEVVKELIDLIPRLEAENV